MYPEDFHVHSTMCDGKNTPEEMVQAAIQQGMTSLGFSVHAMTPYTPYTFAPVEEYRQEIQRLKEKYQGQIRIYCGVEQDCYSSEPAVGYDYVIGSIHRMLINGDDVSVDVSPDLLTAAADKHFNGDIWPVVEEYYRLVGQVVESTGADIIGHFDLVTKFNRKHHLFDENHPRYIAAVTAAADALLATGRPFEINTGAIARGHCDHPFPSRFIQDYLAARGGTFILSSDSHSADTLRYQFDRWEEDALARGIKLVHFRPARG